MDYTQKVELSFFQKIASLNSEHEIDLVQHTETHQIYVQKILDPSNFSLYQNLRQLDLSGIPKIHRLILSDQKLYVIEEYISGSTLASLMESHALHSQMILRIARNLCAILQQIHSHHPPIVHRDIKPENIIFTDQNQVILMDFNAAKFESEKESDTRLLGTPGYAAPEQYGFRSSTAQTDLYAVGILLKEMAASLSFRFKELDPIIEKCTEMNPKDRYQSALDLDQALSLLESPSKQKSENVFRKFLRLYGLPGFRSMTAWKMMLAVPFYCFFICLGLGVYDEKLSTISLWIERITTMAMPLFIVCITFNYRNILSCFPLCSRTRKVTRYIGILLFDALSFTFLLVLMSILVAIIG